MSRASYSERSRQQGALADISSRKLGGLLRALILAQGGWAPCHLLGSSATAGCSAGGNLGRRLSFFVSFND